MHSQIVGLGFRVIISSQNEIFEAWSLRQLVLFEFVLLLIGSCKVATMAGFSCRNTFTVSPTLLSWIRLAKLPSNAIPDLRSSAPTFAISRSLLLSFFFLVHSKVLSFQILSGRHCFPTGHLTPQCSPDLSSFWFWSNSTKTSSTLINQHESWRILL